jgi:hypothetical protein
MMYLTWIINPVSNLVLSFSRFGRLLISKDEYVAAVIAGGGIALGIACATLAFTFDEFYFGICSEYAFTIIIPLSRYYDLYDWQRNKKLTYFTFGLVAVGALALLLYFINTKAYGILSVAYMFGIVAYTWIGGYLSR